MDKQTDIIKDHSGERIVIKNSFDCSEVLNQNKRDQIDPVDDLRFGRKVASVPTIVLDAWIKEGIDYRLIGKDPAMKKKFFAKLNSPEWRYFKTTVGHIG